LHIQWWYNLCRLRSPTTGIKMARLSISLLGPIQVTLDGEPVTDFATDKARALLAYLAVEADRPHRRDALAGLLWPDQPQRRARQNLRQALSHLRQAVGDCPGGEPFLLVSRETIRFNPDCDHRLDVAVFTALVEDCKRHRHRRSETCLPCIRRMAQMVDLYQGDFLEQFFLSDSDVFEEWAVLKREWHQLRVTEALSHLAGYCKRRGEYKRAQGYARQQVRLEPWCEEAHRTLMRLLALDGQRSAALAQYETCCRMLAEELDVEPTDETTTLYESIRTENVSPLLPCPPAPPCNLPSSPTPFIGREEELAELAELLANPDCRLVTIFGPGGIGKTRLALQAAADQVGAFEDGVTFAPLASVGSAERVAPAIADALGIHPGSNQDPKEQLLNYLRDKELLLVLDNMEHILEGSVLLADMLRQARGLVLIVTSRERLNLREEWVYEIEGLTYPEDETKVEEEAYSAVDLFLQHAWQAERRFSASQTEMPHVVRICQLVEGMPLGIELAATWVNVRSCGEIAQEIEHSLDILTTRLRNVPERHRSIWATFEHSWQLLSSEEKDLLARLSVFRGGFRPEAAAEVAGASPTTLAALVDKSLVRYTSSDRYDMHEMLRQYATEKLQSDPQASEETQRQHARYFAAFLERKKEHLNSAGQKQVLLEISTEIENAHQAWQHAVTRGDVPQVEQSLESLYRFYTARCRFQEGIDLFAQAIERWREDSGQASVFGKVLARQGTLYRHLGSYQQAKTALEQSLEIFERLGEQTEQVFCLINLADVIRSQGKYGEAAQLAQESLVLSRQIENPWGMARSLFLLGLVRYRTGDVDQAQALLEESLAIGRESGNTRLTMPPLNTLGDIACHRGDYAKARVVFEECLTLSRELDDRYSVAVHLNNLGTVLHVVGRYEEAKPYYQESLGICHKIGDQNGQAIALSNLGEVAHALGAYREALVHYREALSIGRTTEDQWTTVICLNNLGETACALEDYEAAQAYLAEAVKIAAETQTLTVLLKALVNMAILLAAQDRRGRAATLLGLVRHHPASEQATKEKAEYLLDEMDLAPPDVDLTSLDSVVAEILAEITPPD
jgi:predicted ATPase/DNA-binding SARP family transcriptional activator/Tfp pilus assembly protein PilF